MRAVIDFVLNGIRPAFHPDGGDIELLRYEDGVVEVAYRKGHNEHCFECVMTPEDLREFLLESFRAKVPSVKDVVVVAEGSATTAEPTLAES
jgi:Fe-S cluster biogenesis protein NfuA